MDDHLSMGELSQYPVMMLRIRMTEDRE